MTLVVSHEAFTEMNGDIKNLFVLLLAFNVSTLVNYSLTFLPPFNWVLRVLINEWTGYKSFLNICSECWTFQFLESVFLMCKGFNFNEVQLFILCLATLFLI